MPIILMPGTGIAFLIIYIINGNMDNNIGFPAWFCWLIVAIELSVIMYFLLLPLIKKLLSKFITTI